jgi:DNA-binding MarR family transcriptional regulator
MKDLVSARALAAWRSFLRAHAAAVAAIEADLNRRGLVQLTWYDLLVAVNSAPEGRLRMRELADQLVLTRSNATRLVDKLEAAQLIERHRADEDGRGAVVVLTPAGRMSLRRAWPVYATGINRYFAARLKDRELDVMAVALSRIDSRTR